jgi:hypothetical protein
MINGAITPLAADLAFIVLRFKLGITTQIAIRGLHL